MGVIKASRDCGADSADSGTGRDLECHCHAARHAQETWLGRDSRAACCLRDVPEGTSVRVRGLRGGGGMRSRLCSLGFTPGTEVTVCGRGLGGCRVQLRDTCVVLDRDCAENILCDDSSFAGRNPAHCIECGGTPRERL